MIIRRHVQHVKNSKKSNPTPPFPQASFLKFATLPRDRKWHISKLATLPRAPYQPHAYNYKYYYYYNYYYDYNFSLGYNYKLTITILLLYHCLHLQKSFTAMVL